MSVSSPTDFYLNQNQYSEMKLGARNQSSETTKAVAQQFESLFVQQMLASMRSATSVNESSQSSTVDFYQEMYDKQLALSLSKQGGLGIAKVLLQHLPGGDQVSADGTAKDHSAQDPLTLISGKGGNLLPLGTRSPTVHMALVNRPDLDQLEANSAEVRASKVDHPQLNLSQVNKTVAYPLESKEPLPSDLTTIPMMPTLLPSLFQTDAYKAQNPAVKVHQFKTDDLPASELDAILAQQVGSEQRWHNPNDFVKDLWPHAEKAANAIGISVQALVSQSALETGWGKHSMRFPDGQQAFNLFGIKAGGQWNGPTLIKPTLEFREGVMHTEMAHFRTYESIPEALDDYVQFIQASPRYQNALDHQGNDAHYLKELQHGGYATDPQYADKIINIMQGQTLSVSIDSLNSELHQEQEINHG
jgi:flagellar protein FlgJ|tara:strand:- start:12779 stop:14029 length:1251 start_codon:yes stop_codon:yes gene_type:complete